MLMFCLDLPFGLKCIRCLLHYMDDSLLVAVGARELAEEEFLMVLDLFRSLGISLSEKKLVRLTTCLEFLGIVIDTEAMRIYLPEDKLIRYRQVLAGWLERTTATYEDLDSLQGF